MATITELEQKLSIAEKAGRLPIETELILHLELEKLKAHYRMLAVLSDISEALDKIAPH